MAVYGKHRDEWNPRKQSKAKVSKNRTIQWDTTADGTLLKNFLWCHVSSAAATGSIRHTDGSFSSGSEPTVRSDSLSVLGSSSELVLSNVNASRFSTEGTSFIHGASQLCFNNNISFTERDYWTKNGTYKYISLWLKIDQQHAGGGSDGHSIMAIGRSRTTTHDEPHEFDPWMSISTNSTRQVSVRFSSANTATTGTTYDRKGGSKKVDVTYFTSASSVTDGKWQHVLFAFDNSSSCKIYIDGSLATNGSIIGTGTYSLANRISTDLSALRIGNKCGGYSTIDTATIEADAGFDGSVADFMMFTLEQSPDDVARIVYEASREGVYALHSGIHNSSPRLEQLDLDRDSLYPSNFTLENYTVGGYQSPVSRISSRSESRFTEGYNTSDASYTWSENASQYHIQSTKSGVNETVTTMPHTRLNPADTILTNGNWYSDARSEFFPTDLDATTGFVISNANDTATTKHIPIVSDELYKEHVVSESAKPFLDTDMTNDFKDCFVIEIPIPNTAALLLGTDRQSVHGSSAEVPRIANVGSVTASPGARIANMAYYNFSTKQWEDLNHGPGSSDRDYGLYSGTPADTNFIDQNDVGFSPMSGIIVPTSERIAEKLLPLYGLPTSDFGFPIAQQFAPASGQTIDLSKYIDEPVILEGWEVKTKVIPVVGYSGYTDDTSQDATFGYSSIGSGKSPFHYGAHGDAAVFFNSNKNVTAFDENIYTDGSSNEHHMGTTVPVTNGSTGVELQPANDAKGLVTSGITTFLLKKEKVTDTDSLAETFFLTKDKKKISKLTDLTNAQDFGSLWQTLSAANAEVDKETTYSQHAGGGAVPFIATDNSAFTNSNNTSVLGWLQHVYHNDQYLKTFPTRSFWTRTNDSMNVYRYTQGKNIIGMLGKENITYISNLLYDNTTSVDFQVQGKLKTLGQKDDGIPISNFFIKPASGTSMGIRLTDQSSDISKKYAISTTSETSISFGDSGLADHAIVPRYGAGNSIGKTKMPRINFPSKRSGSDSVEQFHKDVKLFDSLVDASTTVLNPTDELILGIQNSISTAYASQQIKGSSDAFIRWGRTSLTIPAQAASDSTSFLRLFVKKTRSDKDFNIVADSSRYNANVNRDLGDHANADKHIVSNPTIYSGSMADDIIGPTTFTPPIMQVQASVPLAFATKLVTTDGSQDSPHALQAVRTIAYASTSQDWADRFKTDPSTTPPMDGGGFHIEEFKIPWYNASASLFKNRSETVKPRYPAITWNDTWGSFEAEKQWHNALQMFHWPLAKEGTTTDAAGNPQPYAFGHSTSASPFRDQPWAHPFELNTNTGASTHTIDSQASVSLSIMGYDSPGMSAWNLNLMLPVFYIPSSINAMTPIVSILQTEIRLVKIIDQNYNAGTPISAGSTGTFARVPQYSDGTDMSVGDAFYFDGSQNCVKIDLTLDPTGTIPENQKVFRNWVGQRDAKVGPIIFIVGGAVTLAAGSPKQVVANGLNYPQVYSIVSRIAYIHSTWDSSILCTVSNSWDGTLDSYGNPDVGSHDGSFTISIPQDPVLREVFESFKDDLNSMMTMKLCGVAMDTNVDIGTLIDDNVRFWKNGGTPVAMTNMDWNSAMTGGMLAATNYTTQRTNFISDYFLRMTDGTLDNGTLVDLANKYGGNASSTPPGTKLSHTMYKIDFTNMVDSNPILEIVSETYNETIDRRIDRSVQRRMTSKNAVVGDGPLVAGPFGQLKNYSHISGENIILDSLPSKAIGLVDTGYCSTYEHTTKSECDGAHAQWVDKNYMTLLTDIPTEFPFENSDERIKDVSPEGVKIKMKTSAPGGRWDSLTSTVEYTESIEGSNNAYNWGFNAFSINVMTEGSVGLLNVTNYIQKDFRGNSNYEKKTPRDLLIGFGDGVSGKHLLRPTPYGYSGWTGGDPTEFSAEYVMSKPRGSKFGQYNVSRSTESYKFSYTHFGYLRDMLEQSLDTKFINHASNERVFGAPVVVNAINITNPEVPKQMANTSRYNKTINATVTKPYIEDNYEAIQQPVNLESETLRVDVAGAIRSNRVLAPGSISSNIRSR